VIRLRGQTGRTAEEFVDLGGLVGGGNQYELEELNGLRDGYLGGRMEILLLVV